jgi:hypothetical protein
MRETLGGAGVIGGVKGRPGNLDLLLPRRDHEQPRFVERDAIWELSAAFQKQHYASQQQTEGCGVRAVDDSGERALLASPFEEK